MPQESTGTCEPCASHELGQEQSIADASAVDSARAAVQGVKPSIEPDMGLEVDLIKVCGLDLRLLRRRSDYFAACAGDLPIKSTGLVLWECGVLLADYLGFARWIGSSSSSNEQKQTRTGRTTEDVSCTGADVLQAHGPWWMLHPPAPVVPTRFWSAADRGTVLELGGGCGLVAAALASLGARVVCTDGDPAALKTASQNCREARRRAAKGYWGDVKLRSLSWGDAEAARTLLDELGPFSFVVGSDLLYGDAAPPQPLLETLAAMAEHPGARRAEVILAVKNRCADEVGAFCRLAEARRLWDVRLASTDDFPEGYDCRRSFYGSEDRPAYNVIHLTPRCPQEQGEPFEAEATHDRAAGDDASLAHTAKPSAQSLCPVAKGKVPVADADSSAAKRLRCGPPDDEHIKLQPEAGEKAQS